jgi:hypothetical protein
MEIETVIGDTAYSGKENIRLAQEEKRGFEPAAKRNPAISQGF